MSKGVLFLTFAIALAVPLAKLPPPYATPSADNHPVVVPQPSGAALHVPSGFVVACGHFEGFEKPRFLLQGERGEILLADSGSEAQSAAVGQESAGSKDGVIYVFPGGDPASESSQA